MSLSPAARILVSLGIALFACISALFVDAAIWGALLGLVGGAGAIVIALPALHESLPEPQVEPESGEEEDLAREMIDALTDPMMLLSEGRIVAANAAARNLLGNWIERQDVRLALRHPEVVERLMSPPTNGQAREQIEVEGIGDPDRRWMVTIASLRGGARMIHLGDRSEAIAAEKMRVDFVANASHELRTPLATMLGFIETLQDDRAANNTSTRSRFLQIMEGEGKRMQQLIEDLMSLSRIEAERFRAPSDPVALTPLVEEIRSASAQLLAQRRAEMRIESPSGPLSVPGDRGQLLQLVRNLVVNALKYGREGEPVTVRVEEAGPDQVRISVIDRGEGIAPQHLPRLTERFYRVDAGRSRAVGGTGLGLAIVKHIVGRHRGKLDIRSRLGEGTTVEVVLPRSAATAESAVTQP